VSLDPGGMSDAFEALRWFPLPANGLGAPGAVYEA
jgi:hypothetical protein